MTSIVRPATPPTFGPLDRGEAPPRRATWSLDGVVRKVGTALLGLSVIGSAVLLALTGSLLYASLPGIAALIIYLVWTQPARRTLYVVIFMQFFFFLGPYSSSGALWYAMGVGNALINGLLNKVVGLSVLSFTGTEFLFLMLLALIALRELRGQEIDARGRVPIARVIFPCMAIAVIVVVALVAWGAVTGGTVRLSLFQIRSFLDLPLEVMVISYALRDSRDFRTPAIVATIAAALKIAIGIYLLWKDAWPRGIEPAYMTSHGDTVLFVNVIFLWFAGWAHAASLKRFLGMLAIVAWIMVGIVVNDRRIAWVSLVAALLVLYFTVDGMLRRRVNLAAIFAAPLIVAYLAISTKVSSGIFAPGATLMGIANANDDSTQWRIMENQNLIWNFLQHRVLGAGFGKEWVEIIKLPDVSINFKEYRLIGHNSVLWILGTAGMAGFTFLWMPIVLSVFLAARSYRFARSAADRTSAAMVLCIGIVYVNQAWGDIGIADPMNNLLLALGLSLAGKLAVETGAWSNDIKFASW